MRLVIIIKDNLPYHRTLITLFCTSLDFQLFSVCFRNLHHPLSLSTCSLLKVLVQFFPPKLFLNKHSFIRLCPIHLLFLLLISVISFGVIHENKDFFICCFTLLLLFSSKHSFQVPPVLQPLLSSNSTFLIRNLHDHNSTKVFTNDFIRYIFQSSCQNRLAACILFKSVLAISIGT